MDARSLVQRLSLQPHPEGGWFRETHRDPERVRCVRDGGWVERSAATAILYLLETGQVSALHRIRAAEVWHHYAGAPLELVELVEGGPAHVTLLGSDLDAGQSPQAVIETERWFGARPVEGAAPGWSLVGCTVAPGFEFGDFELGRPEILRALFPESKAWIEHLGPAN